MKTIEIELTNLCGLNCITCGRKNLKRFGYLDIKLLNKIIDFIKNNNYNRIIIAGLGDPFLHNEIFNILYKIYKELENIFVTIYTKGDSLDEKKIMQLKKIIKNGYKLEIIGSIFSFNDLDHNFLTGSKYGYKMILSKLILLKKNNIKVETEFLLTSYSYKDLKKYFKFCTILGIKPNIQKLVNWGGNLDRDIYTNLKGKNSFIYKHFIYNNKRKKQGCDVYEDDFLVIDYLGNIFKCCYFMFNINLSLDNIYNSNYINIKKQNNIKKILYKKVCNTCVYYNYYPN